MKARPPGRVLWTGLALVALASVVVALRSGSVAVSWAALWAALSGTGSGIEAELVLNLRLPRALAGFTAGALLAVAGSLMQVLLRNPLADPYTLGISGGAAVAALALTLFGVAGAWLHLGAFGGALAATILVFGLANYHRAGSATRLLLTGVVVSTGWGALISFMLAIAPERDVKGMLFWLMGDLSQATLPVSAVAALCLGLGFAVWWGRDLNLLARGELQAAALGASPRRLRLGVYALGSLFTALAVTIAGSIGFVGLLVPHMLRLTLGSDHRVLLPGAALAGGSLVVVADTLARSLLAPQQLPVGVLMAIIGVPLFLVLLNRGARV